MLSMQEIGAMFSVVDDTAHDLQDYFDDERDACNHVCGRLDSL